MKSFEIVASSIMLIIYVFVDLMKHNLGVIITLKLNVKVVIQFECLFLHMNAIYCQH